MRSWAEAVDACADEAFYGLGELARGGPLEAPAAPLASYQCVGLEEGGQTLLQEKWVALGAFAHGVDDLVRGSFAKQRPGEAPLCSFR